MKYRFAVVGIIICCLGTSARSQSVFSLDHNLFQPSKDSAVTSVFVPGSSGNGTYCVYNTAGELIKNFYSGSVAMNIPQTFVWDGKNNSGDNVASGFYFFRFQTVSGSYTKKLLLIR